MSHSEVLGQDRLFAVAESLQGELPVREPCLRAIAKGLDGTFLKEVNVDHARQLLEFDSSVGSDASDILDPFGGAVLDCTRQGCMAGTIVLTMAGCFRTDWVEAGYSWLGECIDI